MGHLVGHNLREVIKLGQMRRPFLVLVGYQHMMRKAIIAIEPVRRTNRSIRHLLSRNLVTYRI